MADNLIYYESSLEVVDDFDNGTMAMHAWKLHAQVCRLIVSVYEVGGDLTSLNKVLSYKAPAICLGVMKP